MLQSEYSKQPGKEKRLCFRQAQTICVLSQLLRFPKHIENISNPIDAGADPGFLKGRGGGGSRLGLQAKTGGQTGGQFWPNVKKPTSWHKRGVQTPWTPPGSATEMRIISLTDPQIVAYRFVEPLSSAYVRNETLKYAS